MVKFADATGRTLPELQKDLRDGTVGLNDVMKFVIKLSDDHREAALKMADSGMDAGQKLTVAMQQLQLHLKNYAAYRSIFPKISNISSQFYK